MLNSLDRVSVVISEKLKSPVHCIFDAGRVYLSAKTGNGEAKDICPVEGDGQGLEIGFNNRFFMDALRYAPAREGEDGAEHRHLSLHHDPRGRGGEFSLYGPAGAAEGMITN